MLVMSFISLPLCSDYYLFIAEMTESAVTQQIIFYFVVWQQWFWPMKSDLRHGSRRSWNYFLCWDRLLLKSSDARFDTDKNVADSFNQKNYWRVAEWIGDVSMLLILLDRDAYVKDCYACKANQFVSCMKPRRLCLWRFMSFSFRDSQIASSEWCLAVGKYQWSTSARGVMKQSVAKPRARTAVSARIVIWA